MACVLVEPTVTLPKPTLAGVIVSVAWTPLPVTGTTAFTPCEVATVTFPVTCSELVGVNVTFNAAVFPAAKASGRVIPLAVKSFALAVI
jgi:hypothetical protein